MAAMAALSSACLTGLNVTSKSNTMMNARRQLEGAIADYEMGLISRRKLHETHHEAAILIGDVHYEEVEVEEEEDEDSDIDDE